MPKHFYFDDTKDTIINGKLHQDTIWHQVANFELTNQLGKTGDHGRAPWPHRDCQFLLHTLPINLPRDFHAT